MIIRAFGQYNFRRENNYAEWFAEFFSYNFCCYSLWLKFYKLIKKLYIYINIFLCWFIQYVFLSFFHHWLRGGLFASETDSQVVAYGNGFCCVWYFSFYWNTYSVRETYIRTSNIYFKPSPTFFLFEGSVGVCFCLRAVHKWHQES